MSGGDNGFSQKDLVLPGEGKWGFSSPNFAGDQMTAKRVYPLHHCHITQDGEESRGHFSVVYSGTGWDVMEVS